MSVWRGKAPLLLASTSTARRALVEAAGLPVEIEAAGVDERALERGLGSEAAPAVIAERLAAEKAAIVAGRHPDRIVVGADQVLEIDGRPLSKPETPRDAARQIAELSGRTHRLISAVSIRAAGAPEVRFAETASLTMRRLATAEIDAYVAAIGSAALWSPGAYQVEGFGIHLFERIEGEHSTILGLPMLPLLAALRRLNLVGF